MKFYKCNVCGQVLGTIKDTGVNPTCCNEPMKLLDAKEKEDELGEKHIPVYKLCKGKLVTKIGSVAHPATNEHHIEWILVVTDKGLHKKDLKPTETPEATFCLEKGEKVLEIYAFCNLHSLWKKEMK